MTVSTITSVTEIVNSEWIEPLIMSYARDVLVIGELARTVDLRGKASKVATYPLWDKDTAEDLTTEGTTTLTAAELTLSQTQVTVAEVGILREPTKMMERTNLLGEAGLIEYIAQDGGFLCGEMMEDDLAALFSSITLSVGTTKTDFSVANAVEALGKRRTAKARGNPVFVLDDQQATDLQAAVAAATGTVFSGGANQSLLNASSDGVLGDFFGAQVRYTNLTDTANTGEDVVGALLNTGVPESSLGVAMLWEPEIEFDKNLAASTRLYAVNMAFGVGLINDGASVKIVTDA